MVFAVAWRGVRVPGMSYLFFVHGFNFWFSTYRHATSAGPLVMKSRRTSTVFKIRILSMLEISEAICDLMDVSLPNVFVPVSKNKLVSSSLQ